MNLILLEPADFTAPQRAFLHLKKSSFKKGLSLKAGDPRALHIRDILQAKTGDTIRVGAVDGLLGNAELLHSDADGFELQVELTETPPPKLPLTLILALPRPKVLRRVLRSVAELGVADLILLNSYKVEKSYWQSPALDAEAVRGYFLEGLQQARDSVLPALICETRFKPFVEDRLPAIAANSEALFAHPGTDAPPCPLALNKRCTLAIGPEGGFTPYEVEMLQRAGLQQIQIGTRILRVENALTSLIARLFV